MNSLNGDELHNLADSHPEKLLAMQQALKQNLLAVQAPAEQLERLGIHHL